jgi:nucleoside-diphosphate-sugar epimerase
MTFATSLAFYAMIKAHLGEPLTYPGTFESYVATHDASPSAFLAEFNVWCATTPAAGNRVFNAVGGDTYTWSQLWPRVCEYFGAECPDPSSASFLLSST